MKKVVKHYYWVDLLKILACFLVIINHTGGYLLQYSGNENLFIVLFYIFNFVFCKVAVPIFLMVSGVLLLSRNSNYKEIGKRIFRVLVPLVVLSAFIYFRNNHVGFNHFGNFLISFFEKPLADPFWYLYMLIGLYLVMPFLQKVVKNFRLKDYKYFIIICLLLPSLLPVISMYLPIVFNSNFTSALFSMSIGYFVAGFYLSRVELSERNRNIAIVLCIIFLALFACSMIIPYVNSGTILYKLDSWCYITTVIPSLSLFYLIRYYFEKYKFNDRLKHVISMVASLTFGIYLFHSLIIYNVYSLSFVQKIFDFSSYIGIIITEILVFLLAGAVTFVLKKIKYVKDFL